MNREDQRRNAEELKARLLSANTAIASMNDRGNKWTDEKIESTVNVEPIDTKVYDSMSQIDTLEISEQIVNDVKDFKAIQKFNEEIKSQPKERKPTPRQKFKAESPIAAFSEPVASRDAQDFQDFRREALEQMGYQGEPFPLDTPPPITPSPPSKPIAPTRTANQEQQANDALDVVTAVGDFERSMSKFSSTVVASIQRINHKLDSLIRALEAEEYDRI